MNLPVWPIGIALFVLGAGLYLLAYRRHWHSWTAEQRQEFLASLGIMTVINVFVLSSLPNIEAQTLLSPQQMTNPAEIRLQELLLQTGKLLSLVIMARFSYAGLRYVQNRFAPPAEPTPVYTPQELFEHNLPRLLGGIALLLILAVTGQVLEETRLLDSGLATSSSILYMGLAIGGLGLLLQLYAQVNAARQNAALAAGGLLMTLGLGAALCLPQLMGGNTRAEYLIILTGMSVLMGAALPLRVYLDSRQQAS